MELHALGMLPTQFSASISLQRVLVLGLIANEQQQQQQPGWRQQVVCSFAHAQGQHRGTPSCCHQGPSTDGAVPCRVASLSTSCLPCMPALLLASGVSGILAYHHACLAKCPTAMRRTRQHAELTARMASLPHVQLVACGGLPCDNTLLTGRLVCISPAVASDGSRSLRGADAVGGF